jgi:membrane-associated phospholipid phosphatase
MRQIGLACAVLVAGVLFAPGATACDLKAADATSAGAGCSLAWADANLKLNDILTVGTHNSYKRAIPAPVMALVAQLSQSQAEALDYAHAPLAAQLEDGARQLEIDIFNDPQGGRYAYPVAFRLAGVALQSSMSAALAKPGFKVMHIQDVDVLSDCVLLEDCLTAIRDWSAANPKHVPILLMVNLKRDKAMAPGGVDALPFDDAAFDALDKTVRVVFPTTMLITPGDVQGDYLTLREAVLNDNWPTLGAARGRILFAIDEDEQIARAYRAARQDPVFFVNTHENSPDAAYLTLNDPVADAARIRAAVEAGFIVRTRADAGTREVRLNDIGRREAALRSGAQFVSTDYMQPDARFPGFYQVRLEGEAVAICNPVTSADRCAGAVLETRAAAGVSLPDDAAYFSSDTLDGIAILAPPPAPGSARALADRAVFEATRALAGTPRWEVATSDVDTGPFEHFACALGAQLRPGSVPKLERLLNRISTGFLVSPVKAHYQTRRPYLDTDAPICQPRTEHLAQNGDYPSGHAANGWLEALVLSELMPGRAVQILARGRAFGESRVVCGVHSVSAVEAAHQAGASVFAMLHALPEYRDDLEAARNELSTVLASAPAPDAAMCRREADALATPPY